MKKWTFVWALAGMLALAAVLAARGCAAGARRGGAPGGAGRAADLKPSAYESQLEALSTMDESLILYREGPALVVEGLDAVTAVAVGPDGRIYVGGGRRLAILTAQGDEAGRIDVDGDITCLAVDARGYLAVGLGRAVHTYDAEGRRAAVFDRLRPDVIVTSMAAVEEDVFVADARSRTVLRFAWDGILKQTIDGRQGAPDDLGFIVPSPYFDIMPGQGGTLWIVNPGRHRLEEYTFNGERIGVWPETPGMGAAEFCGCCNPTHIAQLGDGSVVTAEKGLARVKVYTRRGRFVGVVAAPNRFDSQETGFDLAVDASGRVLVADPVRAEVRVFERK